MKHPIHFPVPPVVRRTPPAVSISMPLPTAKEVANIMIGWHASKNTNTDRKPSTKVKMAALLVRMGYTDG